MAEFRLNISQKKHYIDLEIQTCTQISHLKVNAETNLYIKTSTLINLKRITLICLSHLYDSYHIYENQCHC